MINTTQNIISNLSVFHCGLFAAFYCVVGYALWVYHRSTKGAIALAGVSLLSGLAHFMSAYIFIFDPNNNALLLALGGYCTAATPSVLLCIKEAITPGWLTKKKYLLLLSPFFLGMALCYIFANKNILYFFIALEIIFSFTCAGIFWKGIDRREKAVKDYFTEIESFGHGWVKSFIVFQLFVSVSFFFFFEYHGVLINIIWNYIQAAFWLYFLLKSKEQRYYSTQIPDDVKEIIDNATNKEEQRKKDEEDKNPISADKKEFIEKRLLELKEQKIYTSNSLTLSTLAQEVGTNRTYLSAFFHQNDTTFYDYINALRCEHAITLMKRNPGYTISEISSQCGYKTENSFRTAFSAIYGKTPASYKREFRNG